MTLGIRNVGFPIVEDVPCPGPGISTELVQCSHWPPLRIRGGVAEHVEEDGLGEGVELGEGGWALGPQRVRFVQDLRNPSLLVAGWKEDPRCAFLHL